MDITMLTGFVVFIVKGKTWRLPLTMAIFYLLRLLIQKTFLMRYPEGYLWENPGFPSITVPYGKTNDFFFSGHVGGAVIMTIEYFRLMREIPTWNWKLFMKIMTIVGVITTILQVFLMIFLRGHYSIDMFAGAMAGHYISMLVKGWAPFLDRFV